MNKARMGRCLLTGIYGPFVKSHILPKSLTKPEYEGGMLFQHQPGARAQKRRTSWYDPGIVCAEGEKILADIDDWAISFLRRNRLVWSGFGPVTRIETDIPLSGIDQGLVDYGVRKITVDEPEKLRKFFLSLLWRASVSNLPEMHEVKLTKVQEVKISDYLAREVSLEIEFFPCWLTQHHQIGFKHNQTPTKGLKSFPKDSVSEGEDVSIYRFYFDGLVVHFHEIGQGEFEKFSKNSLTVGFGTELFVTCVPWDKSAQLENIKAIAKESLW